MYLYWNNFVKVQIVMKHWHLYLDNVTFQTQCKDNGDVCFTVFSDLFALHFDFQYFNFLSLPLVLDADRCWAIVRDILRAMNACGRAVYVHLTPIVNLKYSIDRHKMLQ